MTRAHELHRLMDEVLDARWVSVPLDDPLPKDLSTNEAFKRLNHLDYDLAIVELPTVEVITREELAVAAKADPDAPISRYAGSPQRSRLIDRTLPLRDVIDLFRDDHSPLLVVGHGGVNEIITVADFAGVSGTAVTLTALTLLDADIDRLLHETPARQYEAFKALSDDERKAAERLADTAQDYGARLSALSYASFGARLDALRRIGPIGHVHVPGQDAKLLRDVRNHTAHGQQLGDPTEALAALRAALTLLSAIAEELAST